MAPARKTTLIISLLVLTIVLGFTLRTVWNAGAAQTEDGEYVLSGNDPYYHKHAVDHITENWESIHFDPMLNYPVGSVNPNPPLYEWSIAVGAQIMEPFAGSMDTAAWWSTLYSPAIWGTLTIIPVFLIGRHFAGPWAGLLAGFLVATSPEHMSRSNLGFSDHDAIVLFLVSCGFYFLIRSIDAIGTEPQTTTLGSLTSDFGDWFSGERFASGSAVLAGTFFGAMALVWKGFPYAYGILIAYAGIQLLINHWRRKEIGRPFFSLFTTLAVAALLGLPYYASFGLMHFWNPALFLLLALTLLGVFFLATQDYPPVLVLPGLLIVLGVFAAVMFFLVPEISRALLSRFIYFRQTALYETIAEARPASFSNLSFTVGPIPFLVYIAGFFWLFYRVWTDKKAIGIFLLTWAGIDFFMGISAVRFLSLIVPSMAILASVTTVWMIRAMELPNLIEGYRVAGGGWRGIRRSTNVMHILAILFVGVLILAPNAFLAVDAAVPANLESQRAQEARERAIDDVTQAAQQNGIRGGNLSQVLQALNQSRSFEDFESRVDDMALRLGFSDQARTAILNAARDEFDTISLYQQRFGAFGQNFLPRGWRDALHHLRGLDTEQEPGDRPAFIAWWDYGHWSISVGKHPAVADNFQNGYHLAGSFLVAQNESHAIQLLGARYAEIMDEDEFTDTLQDHGISQFNATRYYDAFTSKDYPYVQFSQDEWESIRTSNAWLQDLEAATGKKVRYVATDNRMLPIDNPDTRFIESGSIFYAPVTLAGEDPNDFVETITVNMDTGEELSDQQLRQLRRSQQQVNVGQQLQYKESFFNSTYYRTFMGLPARPPVEQQGRSFPVPFQIQEYPAFYQQGEDMLLGQPPVNGLALTSETAPGFGMRHFRLIYANNAVRLLQYTPGATVSGEVTLGDQPLDGVRVTVFDDAGDQVLDTNPSYFASQDRTAEDMNVPHDSVLTDANGTYELVVPFSKEGPLTFKVTQEVRRGAPPLLATATLEVSEQQAEQRRSFDLDFDVEPASVTGAAYHDADADGERDTDEDLLTNATIRLQGREATTNEDGRYQLEELSPGRYTIRAQQSGYQLRSGQASVTLEPGNETTHDLPFQFAPVTVEGTLIDGDGTRTEGVNTQFLPAEENTTARQASSFSGPNGTVSVQVQPGAYVVQGNGTDTRTNEQLVIVGLADASGQGVSINEDGELVIEPGAENVRVQIDVERRAA